MYVNYVYIYSHIHVLPGVAMRNEGKRGRARN